MMDTLLRDTADRTRSHFESAPIPAFVPGPVSGGGVGLGPRLVLAAAVLLLVAAAVAVAAPWTESSDRGVADVDVQDEPPTTEVPSETTAPTTPDPGEVTDPALVSVGLPVTVHPQVDLVDGQVVTVRGRSFPSGSSVYIGQCTPLAGPVASIDRCDRTSFVVATADADGTFVAEYQLRRVLEVGGASYDCAGSPAPGDRTACNLVAAPNRSESENGQAPLYFDPSAPLAERAALTLSRSDGLADFEVVDVTITDPSSGGWTINQCTTTASGPMCLGSNVVGAAGSGVQATGGSTTAQVIVRRWIGDVDCLSQGGICSVAVDGAVLGEVDLWLCATGAARTSDCTPVSWYDSRTTPSGAALEISPLTDQIRTPTGPIVGCGQSGACEVVQFNRMGQRLAGAPIVVTRGSAPAPVLPNTLIPRD